MRPCSRPPTWSSRLSARRPRRAQWSGLSAVLAALALTTACATKPTAPPSPGWMSFPLQATSQQAPLWVPPPIAAAAPGLQCVTGPWMEEQLRRFDDRYAGAAADIRAVLEQALASTRAVSSTADLKPITAGLGKVNADLAMLNTRIDGLVTGLQARTRDLERALGDVLAARPAAPTPAPAATGSDPLSEAFAAIHAPSRQTLPLRAWLESHPGHPQAAEALLQLGMAFLDSGYPSAATHYFTRLIDGYGTSLQAAEAKALLDSVAKPEIKATRKRGPKSSVRASKRACHPQCQSTVAAPPLEMAPAPPAKPAATPAGAASAPTSNGARFALPATGQQPNPPDAGPPGSSPLSPGVRQIK